LDLTFRDKILQGTASYKIYTTKNIIAGKEYTGYAGVLVTNSIFGGYKAFDIACPNETRTDAVVEIDEDNNAVCKVCGSKYEVILNYGSGVCIGGPSKHPLRQYMTSLKNKTLTVSN
jgi:nitrite reductase/ring-hydroxylating ferredoxin subunit